MSTKDTQSLNPSRNGQGKDTKFKAQLVKDYRAFEAIPMDSEKTNIGIEEISIEVESLLKSIETDKESKGLFKVKSANKWIEQARARLIPKMLFGEFWFENELCILFADTNLGKSILAVQIGNSISKGECIPGFKFEAQQQPILYFDFELSDKQFENRYSIEYNQHYIFDNDFIRVEIDPDANIPDGDTFENYLNISLERSIIETSSKILIIDNLTYLKNETEKSRDALPLMKYLKALKSKYDLSILVLAHTPKRDLSKPISRNDLAGSKMLINFVDSCFSIGESHSDKHIRYIKQIKARNTEIIYDTENVAVCQIYKAHNFLQFEFVDYGSEMEHLKQISKEDRETNVMRVKELSEGGMTQREIAHELSISLGTVNNYLKK
jgi:RecA-family ATPase